MSLLLAGVAAPAQVASPTGQANGKPKAPAQTTPSTRAPRLGTPPRNAPATPITPLVPIRTEVGARDHASFRIDVPRSWNHKLVVYFHGYESRPLVFHGDRPPSRVLQPMLNRGYAVIESGYAVGGWAVPQAAQETNDLRKYFAHKYGAPQQTFAMGHSMGGLLTVMSLEQTPKNYAGGLALCAVLMPANFIMQRAFANRVAFDAFFPGVLPPVEQIPDNFGMNDAATIGRVQKVLDADEKSAAIIRQLADIHTNRGLADVLVFNTFLIKDLRQKSGGNPFDNRNLIYTGTTDDAMLNDRVRRYAADPEAFRFVSDYYSPTGKLQRKLLALHTVYDPLVPAGTAEYYDELTRRLGHGDELVQQYVDRTGHCNITADQTGRAFDELVRWVDDGQRPRPGLLPGEPQTPPLPAEPRTTVPKDIGKPENSAEFSSIP